MGPHRVPLPKKLDHTNKLQGIYDQGTMQICAAAVAACCKEWQERDSTGGAKFSPMYVYNQRSNKPGEGMHGRNVMDILSKSGCCRNGYYSSNIFNVDKAISPKAVIDGKNYLISGYAQVTTIEGLKQALISYGPCYIAFPVYNHGKEFWVKNNDQMIGGHAVTVVGYDDTRKAFKLRNSWGLFWGDGGYTWFPYSHFHLKWEIWSMVDAASPNNPPPEPGCKCVVL